MNAQQRKVLADICLRINGLDASREYELMIEQHVARTFAANAYNQAREAFANILQGVAVDIENVRDEEQEKLDNMPESLQSGEKGEAMQEGINALEEAMNTLESVADDFNESSDHVDDDDHVEQISRMEEAAGQIGEL